MIEKITLQMTEGSELAPANGLTCDRMNPKVLMLYAGALCSGHTVLMIMQKQHIRPEQFEISITGELSSDISPAASVFTAFHVAYNIACRTGKDSAKAYRAANLAHEKHCPLMQMLAKIAPVTADIAVVITGNS